jgi:hypothetical protein
MSDGGCEDPAPGPDALPRRSPGNPPVPKRWTCRVQDHSRGGCEGVIPRSFPHSSQASYEPRYRRQPRWAWTARADALLGVNFTAYQELKKLAAKLQPDREQLPSYQHMLIGLISGAMGPFSNAPIDTIKTRENPAGNPLPLALTLYTYNRSAEVTDFPWPERVSKDICNCPRYVASRGLPSVLQGHHSSCAPCRPRTGHRICRI